MHLPETFTISPSVTDGTDPVEGAVVKLMQDSTVVKTCTTGSAGGCSMTEVPAGDYTLTCTAEDFEDYTDDYTVSKTETVNITLTA